MPAAHFFSPVVRSSASMCPPPGLRKICSARSGPHTPWTFWVNRVSPVLASSTWSRVSSDHFMGQMRIVPSLAMGRSG
jgi:hypothetical protein